LCESSHNGRAKKQCEKTRTKPIMHRRQLGMEVLGEIGKLLAGDVDR
jgi:hypothetical protein